VGFWFLILIRVHQRKSAAKKLLVVAYLARVKPRNQRDETAPFRAAKPLFCSIPLKTLGVQAWHASCSTKSMSAKQAQV